MRNYAIAILAFVLVMPSAAALSVSSDAPSMNVLFRDEVQLYSLNVSNTENVSQQVTVSSRSDVSQVIKIQETFNLDPGDTNQIPIEINATNETDQGLYLGSIVAESELNTQSIPIGVRLVNKQEAALKVNIQATTETIRPDGRINVLSVISTNQNEDENGSVTYEIRSSSSGEEMYSKRENITIGQIKSYQHELDPLNQLDIGDYYIQARVSAGNNTVSATNTFSVTNPFWTPQRVKIAVLLICGAIIISGGVYTRSWYEQHKQEEARYVFPVDYSKLPEEDEDTFEVGKIAETEKEAYIDPSDLTTHAIVAGSTGSGKSVTANVIAEEALENDIPIVVFDPTAQWTGFVKELKDDDLLEHYDRFGMDPDTDPHPYRGIIKEIKSGDPDIDFQEIKQPGEVTVFTLNNITTEEFDQAVRTIIDQIFEIEWEESPTLELLIVFDEVHRLLEEYGGEGGYKSLEKGAREFRKWGIGLMMCSQVTADFKQAIAGNIMTEVQMQTKSMEDIDRVETKYGEQFAKRISSEDVGTGMIQNSNYNDGDPWFVDFRPTYHNPHKIPDKELQKYHKLSTQLDEIKEALKAKKEDGEDTRDKELELQLAENKLKEGRFKMASMYIDTLKDEMGLS